MTDWPETLPHLIVRDSFRLLAPARPPKRTEFEDGPKRGRRSSTLNIATIGFDLSFAATEFATFVAFERDDLVDGTLRFTMPVRIAPGTYADRDVWMVRQFETPGGRGGVFVTVRLTLDVTDWGG